MPKLLVLPPCYCEQCGASNKPNALFCQACGEKFVSNEPAIATPPPPPEFTPFEPINLDLPATPAPVTPAAATPAQPVIRRRQPTTPPAPAAGPAPVNPAAAPPAQPVIRRRQPATPATGPQSATIAGPAPTADPTPATAAPATTRVRHSSPKWQWGCYGCGLVFIVVAVFAAIWAAIMIFA